MQLLLRGARCFGGGEDQPLGWEQRRGDGAGAEPAGEGERAAMQLHQLAADGKAEAGAFDLARDHGIAALERVEHLCQRLFGDAAAGVADRDGHAVRTGTGLAPFLSLIKDPEVYERYERVVLVHGCRRVAELAYMETITDQLPNDPLIGELVRAKLTYYPTVTREPFRHNGRITALIETGKLFEDIGLPSLNRENDRAAARTCCPTCRPYWPNVLSMKGTTARPATS